jgi:hypothetical protein
MSSQRKKLFTRSCDRGQKESQLCSSDETYISSRASPISCSNYTNRAGEVGGGYICRAVTRAKRFIAVHARREDGYSTNAVLIRKAIQNSGGHHKEIRRTKHEKRVHG